jgi:hypothetical protein
MLVLNGRFIIYYSKGYDVEFPLYKILLTIKMDMSNKISYLLLILIAGNTPFYCPKDMPR